MTMSDAPLGTSLPETPGTCPPGCKHDEPPSIPETADHVMKIDLSELVSYHLTCNLDDTAKCHQTCSTHPDGGCGDPDLESECVTQNYGTCVIAEWVNDGGIESVQFEHVVEIPVSYYWDGAHDFPILVAKSEDHGEKL